MSLSPVKVQVLPVKLRSHQEEVQRAAGEPAGQL
jgi:hypothetical protein